MSSANELLSECSALGIGVTALHDGDLWIDPIEQLPETLRLQLVEKKPELVACLKAERLLHVHCVITKLRKVGIHRIGDELEIRFPGSLTPELVELLDCNRDCLLDALRPRALTDSESEHLAIWLNSIEEPEEYRHDVFTDAENDPRKRTAYLWMASGSAEQPRGEQ